jgi:predicted Zn finger-like uncharacterized protein
MLLACPDCYAKFKIRPVAIGEGRTVRCSRCKNEWFAEPRDLITEEDELSTTEVEEAAEQLAEAAEHAAERAFEEDEVAATAEALSEAKRDDVDEDVSGHTDDIDDTHELGHEEDAELSEPEEDIDIDALEAALAKETSPVMGGEPQTKSTKGIWFAVIIMILVIAATCFVLFRSSILPVLPFTSGIYSMIGYADTSGLVLKDIVAKKEKFGKKTKYNISGVIHNQTDSAAQSPVLSITILEEDGNMLKNWELTGDKEIPANATMSIRPQNLETFYGEPHSVDIRIGSPMELWLND